MAETQRDIVIRDHWPERLADASQFPGNVVSLVERSHAAFSHSRRAGRSSDRGAQPRSGMSQLVRLRGLGIEAFGMP